MKPINLSSDEVSILNICLAYTISQIGDKQHGFISETVPNLDPKQLCRLRAKIEPNIGISESIDLIKK